MRLGTADVLVRAKTDKFNKDIDKSEKKVKSFSISGKKSLTGLTKEFASLSKQAGIVGIAFSATLAFGMKKAVDAASNLQEVQGKFDVVFEKNIKSAENMAEILVESYAMSTREAKQYLSSIQDLLVPMGMMTDQAFKMSSEVVKLSADLASFNNLPTAKVMEDIQSALVGNFETMKKYGVVLNETVVKQKALEMGLYGGKGMVDANTKAHVAFTLMLEGSAAAIGDQERTMGSYANQMKLFTANVENISAAIGDELLPEITEWVSQINEAIKQNPQIIKDLGEFVKNILDMASAMGKVIGKGVEFANVWVKTWQALGLASTGMIDFKTAMFDGINALETFDEALGPEKLRLAFLERVIATGKYTSKVYWEAKRLRELIDALPDIDVAKKKEDVAKKKEDVVKKKKIEEVKKVKVKKVDDSWIKNMQAQEVFALKMADVEQERLNARYELEQEINAKIHDELLSDTEFKLQELDKQFLAADSFVKDKAMLDEWYVKKYEEIAGTQKQAYMNLYNNFGILTQESYDQIYESYVKDRDDFIALTGDKETAHQMFTERLTALNEEMEAGNKSWIDGAKAGLEGYAEKSNDTFITMKELAINSLKSMEDAFVELATTGKLNMKQLAASVIRDLIRIAVQAAITKAIMAGLGALDGGGGGGAAPSAGSVAPASASTPTTGTGQSPQLMAKGGIFANGLSSHSNSIVDSPTFFSFAKGQGLMGEAGPEAIMPLTRLPGGDLGVKTETSKAAVPAMTVNIHEAPGTQTRVEQSEDRQSLEVIIEQVEQSMQSRMSRGTGMAPFMDGRYGRAY